MPEYRNAVERNEFNVLRVRRIELLPDETGADDDEVQRIPVT